MAINKFKNTQVVINFIMEFIINNIISCKLDLDLFRVKVMVVQANNFEVKEIITLILDEKFKYY